MKDVVVDCCIIMGMDMCTLLLVSTYSSNVMFAILFILLTFRVCLLQLEICYCITKNTTGITLHKIRNYIITLCFVRCVSYLKMFRINIVDLSK